ncbi:MAG TPA: hypothetical protein VFA46_14585 [Actinomycetes bacterium]|jgi:hypothetical protein|nr:hypothetical protein [Actinomycetes bacterium]
MSSPELPREELAAVLETRRELGEDYEHALVESLAERLDRVIDARVQARVAEHSRISRTEAASQRAKLQLGIASVALGIPISAIASSNAGVWGLLVAWGGIAAVNVGHALSQRPRRRP